MLYEPSGPWLIQYSAVSSPPSSGTRSTSLSSSSASTSSLKVLNPKSDIQQPRRICGTGLREHRRTHGDEPYRNLEPPANMLVVDIRVRVTGGGHTSQIYAIRQAIAKALIAYYQKYVDEHSKNLLKQALVQFDRTLLVADNRRCEPKKFGGPGARARFQKSYR